MGLGAFILLVGLDVSHLTTIGTLSRCSSRDLIAAGRRGTCVGASSGCCLLLQFFLLLSGLSSCLILLESLELLSESIEAH